MTIRDFLKGNTTLEILCPRKRVAVRKLKVVGDNVEVDAIEQVVTVPLDTELKYDAWVMDRGSILFWVPGVGLAKFCTELDLVEYGDGTTGHASHPDSTLFGLKA